MLLEEIAAGLRASFGRALRGEFAVHGKELRVEVTRERLAEAAAWLVQQRGASLLTMVGCDDRPRDKCFRLYAVFSLRPADTFVTLVCRLRQTDPAFPSLTRLLPSANWYERELRDLLGLEPMGHPDPRRLVLHENWPDGIHPLRHDVPRHFQPEQARGEFPWVRVEGDGVLEIPVGPIHAGIIEPGHFRFSAVGELIVHLEARLFYTHRGLEKRAEGMSLDQGLLLAERICGVCAFSHAVAYAQAVEALAGVEAPPRARYLRTIGLELERLYNHVGDIGNLCAGAAFHFGNSQGARLREELLRVNERFSRHRYLRGLAAPGGVRADLEEGAAQWLGKALDRIESDFRQVAEVLLNNDSLLDRLRGTGRLAPEVVRDLEVVGVAARAAGVDRDARRDHPHAAYGDLAFPVPLETGGDVLARMQVRMEEVYTSFDLIRQALAGLPGGPVRVDIGAVEPHHIGLGIVESPRGEDVHWLMSGPDNSIYRYRVRSAAYHNWPAVPFAVQGNIVPDFPLINKSFELCYACLDR